MLAPATSLAAGCAKISFPTDPRRQRAVSGIFRRQQADYCPCRHLSVSRADDNCFQRSVPLLLVHRRFPCNRNGSRQRAALMSHSREDLAATLRSLLRGTASALRALTWYPRASSLHSPEETFILPYDMLDDVQLRSWELESNVRRKPFMRDALYPVASFLMLPKQGVRLLGVKQTSTSCWSSVLDFLLSRYSHALCHCQILRRRPSSSTSISSDTVSRGVG